MSLLEMRREKAQIYREISHPKVTVRSRIYKSPLCPYAKLPTNGGPEEVPKVVVVNRATTEQPLQDVAMSLVSNNALYKI